MSEDINKKYKNVAQIIIKNGILPFPISETLLEILKFFITPEDLDFLLAFKRKASQTMDELIKSSKMSEKEILEKVKSLAKKGVIFNQPSSAGIMVYRLLPLFTVGLFEYTFMKKLEFSEKEKKLAELFRKLFNEERDIIQERYDTFAPLFKQAPPVDRTIPLLKNEKGNKIEISVNKDIEVPIQKVMPAYQIEKIIEKFNDIAVSHCFCRQHKDLLNDPCKITDIRENCFTFGKSARYIANQEFGRMISKKEALEILNKSVEFGLVHKTFHPNSDIYKDETSVCNCCKDCCATFEMWKMGATPMVNATNYLASINQELCQGCGTCVEKCPTDATRLNEEGKSELNPDWCIGCGICAHFCPESAISLLEGPRTVSVLPPRLRS